MKELKKSSNPPDELQRKAMAIGENIFEEQLMENFGESKLQEKIYKAANGELVGLYREIWNGYICRSRDHFLSLDGKKARSEK